MKKINKHYVLVTAEENNELLALGYKYKVRGDFEVLDSIDPWSGMPNVKEATYYFKDKEEADTFATTQLWPFSGESFKPYELKREETKAEYEERTAKEKENAKAKKLANEIKKAEAEGMTLEEYRKAKSHKAHIKRVETEIAKLEKELAYKKRYLEELKAR